MPLAEYSAFEGSQGVIRRGVTCVQQPVQKYDCETCYPGLACVAHILRDDLAGGRAGADAEVLRALRQGVHLLLAYDLHALYVSLRIFEATNDFLRPRWGPPTTCTSECIQSQGWHIQE